MSSRRGSNLGGVPAGQLCEEPLCIIGSESIQIRVFTIICHVVTISVWITFVTRIVPLEGDKAAVSSSPRSGPSAHLDDW